MAWEPWHGELMLLQGMGTSQGIPCTRSFYSARMSAVSAKDLDKVITDYIKCRCFPVYTCPTAICTTLAGY